MDIAEIYQQLDQVNRVTRTIQASINFSKDILENCPCISQRTYRHHIESLEDHYKYMDQLDIEWWYWKSQLVKQQRANPGEPLPLPNVKRPVSSHRNPYDE